MKLFARSGGHWLFWSGFIYLSLTAVVAFSPYRDYTMCVQLVWLVMVALPLICNPLARWLNMKENTMFDLFKKNKMPKNVVPFPTPKAVEPPKLVEPPKTPEKPATTYYEIGHTTDNRVSIKMGFTTVTMNSQGVQNLIDQLALYQSQLREEQE
jgi:hypothetical protein